MSRRVSSNRNYDKCIRVCSRCLETTLNRLTGLSAEASMLMTRVFENKMELKLLNGFHPFILVLLFAYPLSELICPLIFLAHFL